MKLNKQNRHYTRIIKLNLKTSRIPPNTKKKWQYCQKIRVRYKSRFLDDCKSWIMHKVFCKAILFFIMIYSYVHLQNCIFAKKEA